MPFPEAGLLGTVTGFCFSPDDIDVATVFTAAIAYRITVVRGAGRWPKRRAWRAQFSGSA